MKDQILKISGIRGSKILKSTPKKDLTVIRLHPITTIEVVWAIMESRVEMRNPKTIQELKNILIEVWDSLSWQTINGLVATMPERIRTVNDNPDKTIWRLTRV